MAYIRIQTNCYVDETFQDGLLTALSQMVAKRLGKTEDHVMITIQDSTKMCLGGTYDPAAFVEVRSLELDAEDTTPLADAIAQDLKHYLQIPMSRVYITFTGVTESMWAWHNNAFSVWSEPRRRGYGGFGGDEG
jgi:phenylpyruvate tautomerase